MAATYIGPAGCGWGPQLVSFESRIAQGRHSMHFPRIAAFAALVLLLGACSKFGGGNQTVHAPDYLVRGNGVEVKRLDPDYTAGDWEATVLGDMLVGLTTDAANGDPMPGAATSWETSADGKTWTFHLRDHVWSD